MMKIVTLLLIGLVISADVSFDTSKAIKDSGSAQFDDSVTARKLVDDMGFGWNLGNTFDATNKAVGDEGLSSETEWFNPKTTPEMIAELKKKGFKTIRIPVSWHNHIIDKQYTIDPNWTKRVKEVVDDSIKNGLYVILNTHHDNSEKNSVEYGAGYYPNKNSQAESEKFLVNTWSQITLAFNSGYDHHLIFEGLNEPRQRGDQYEWWYQNGVQSGDEAMSVVNDFNKLILSTIRKSGGNNAKRFYMLTAPAAAYSYTFHGNFNIPDDSQYNPSNKKILISIHMYTPYDFAMNGKGPTQFTDKEKSELDGDFRQLHDKFVSQGHHVVIGEMGVINKNNLNDRIAWAKYFVENARKNGLACVVWDNGNWDNSKSADETFGLFHRSQGTWEPEELVNAYISAAKTSMG